jgi:hypothetical protein
MAVTPLDGTLKSPQHQFYSTTPSIAFLGQTCGKKQRCDLRVNEYTALGVWKC